MRFAFIDVEKANHSVRTLCRVLQVSKSGYYAYLRRGPSRRKRQDDALKVHITTIHQRSGGTYGSPRVYEQLRHEDFEVGRDRVARLMREMQVCGKPKRCPNCRAKVVLPDPDRPRNATYSPMGTTRSRPRRACPYRPRER